MPKEGPLIAFGQSVDSILSLSDAEFFASIEWEKSAPARLQRAAQADELERVVHLVLETAGGSPSRRPAACESNGARQSLWSRHHLEESLRTTTLIRAWDALGTAEDRTAPAANGDKNGDKNGQPLHARKAPFVARNGRRRTSTVDFWRAADRWTQMCAEGPPLSVLETLVLFEILRDAGRRAPATLAAKLWRTALTAAIQRTNAGSTSTVHDVTTASPAASPESCRIVDVELAWQAGLLFAPVSGAERVAASARNELCRMLLESTDSGGVPSAEMVDELPNWLATLVRGREWGRRFACPLFDVPHERRFRALLGAMSRLCRGDGRPAFSNGQANGLCKVWLAAAGSVPDRRTSGTPAFQYLLSLGADRPRRPIRGRRTNGRPSRATNTVRHKRVNPVFQSDNSRLACLRSNWTRDANSLTVLHHGRFPAVELAAREKVLLTGDWEIEIRVGDEGIAFDGPWSCSCWYSDDEGDYLELQARLTAEIRIERQLLLARKDDLLFLADAVFGCGDARIDYVSRLPLAPGIEALPNSPTRECRLAGTAAPARLFPLGLPCERVQGSAGQLAGSRNLLELRQTGIGGLYAPIVIDWNPTRRRSPASWRPLTVGQNGAVVPAGCAAGFRLQVGTAQWLVYRSLSPILEPRTVLGQHTMYETMIGRFVRSGEVEPIVLVEQRAEGN
jgi:hypothetical protein